MSIEAYGYSSWQTRMRDPALIGLLAIQCMMIFLAAPLAPIGNWGARALSELLILAFAVLVYFVSRGPVTAAIAAAAMIAGVMGSALQLWAPSSASSLLAHIASFTALTVAAYIVGRAVFAPGTITRQRVLGAIGLYLNIGLMFATVYRLIWDIFPQSMGNIPSDQDSWQAYGTIIYFSFVTLTTVGYGDVVPIHPFARALSNLEAIIGQLYPATLLARLVAQELEQRRV